MIAKQRSPAWRGRMVISTSAATAFRSSRSPQGRRRAAAPELAARSAGAAHHHFATSDAADTAAHVHAMGPFEITCLNPADDPRSKKQAAAQ